MLGPSTSGELLSDFRRSYDSSSAKLAVEQGASTERRPLPKASAMKSIDHPWFGRTGAASGTRALAAARLRFRRHTARPTSRYSR
jgi:hypothetical protein